MVDNTPISFPLEKIDLAKLKLYPKEYQFRLGQAASGEVETQKINDKEWNPLLHGAPIYVHKRRDENGEWEYAVVDGHHRVNFAQRLAAEGKAPAQLDAYVLEEEKGINTETAKLMLAFKDIARSDAKNPVETATVLKEAREAPGVRMKFLPSLKMDTENMRLAVKFSGLSDKSLALLASGEVPQKAVELVIDRTPNDPAQQDRVLEIIGVKMKQQYPNYLPNTTLATTLAPKANDNKSWVEKIAAQEAGRSTSFAPGA